MKKSSLEKKVRAKLASQGIRIERGSPADRSVKSVAEAVTHTREWLERTAESAREAIHEATKPRGRR